MNRYNFNLISHYKTVILYNMHIKRTTRSYIIVEYCISGHQWGKTNKTETSNESNLVQFVQLFGKLNVRYS